MGGVFAAATQAPLTAIASVVEMTGNFGITLAVMLAAGVAAALSKHLTYGSIYTTKLLRRGIDIERPRATSALEKPTVADVLQPLTDGDGQPSLIQYEDVEGHSAQAVKSPASGSSAATGTSEPQA